MSDIDIRRRHWENVMMMELHTTNLLLARLLVNKPLESDESEGISDSLKSMKKMIDLITDQEAL